MVGVGNTQPKENVPEVASFRVACKSHQAGTRKRKEKNYTVFPSLRVRMKGSVKKTQKIPTKKGARNVENKEKPIKVGIERRFLP